jgi:hypothetical protein
MVTRDEMDEFEKVTATFLHTPFQLLVEDIERYSRVT